MEMNPKKSYTLPRRSNKLAKNMSLFHSSSFSSYHSFKSERLNAADFGSCYQGAYWHVFVLVASAQRSFLSIAWRWSKYCQGKETNGVVRKAEMVQQRVVRITETYRRIKLYILIYMYIHMLYFICIYILNTHIYAGISGRVHL